MQEQQRQQRAAQVTVAQQRNKTAPETSLTSEDTFDAMRQAAVTMFKQRTKDLTKLSQLQEHQQALEGQLAEVQATAGDLQAHQAQLEASAEKEEQRAKERTALLQQLRATMTSLGDEQRVFHSVSRATERMAAVTQAAFQTDGAGADGPVARLLNLVSQAQIKTAGRTTGDFRNISTDLRRREAMTRELVAEARRIGAIPKALLQAIQEWVTGNWRKHAELAAVVAEGKAILRAYPAAPAAPPSRPASPRASPGLASSVQLTLQTAASASIALDEDALFASIDGPDNGLGPCDAASVALMSERVRQSIGVYQNELRALKNVQRPLTEACELLGVVCEGLDTRSVEAVTGEWGGLIADLEGLVAQLSERFASMTELASATEVLQLQQAALDAHRAREAALLSDLAAHEARGGQLEAEVANYAAAWRKVYHTGQVQTAALAELEQAIGRATDAIVATEDETAALGKTADAEVKEQEAEATALNAALATAEAAARDAASDAAAAQAEWASISETVNRLGSVFAPFNVAGATDAELELADGDVAAILRQLDIIRVDPSWADGDPSGGAMTFTAEFTPTEQESLTRFLCGWDGTDTAPLLALLAGDSVSLALLCGATTTAFCLSALRSTWSGYHDEQRAIALHVRSMTDMRKETVLLEAELQ